MEAFLGNLFKELANSHKALAKAYAKAANHVPAIEGSKKRKAKDPDAPKRSPSNFLLFCAKYRETHGKTAVKELADMWSKLSAEQKRPYEIEAAALKEEYMKDKKKYEERKAAVEAGAGAGVEELPHPVGSSDSEPETKHKRHKKKHKKRKRSHHSSSSSESD